MAKILVLGAGRKARPGTEQDQVVTVDINPHVGADVIHDLDIFPWPFKDNEFDQIHLDHVLEHLTDIPKIMDELHRVSAPHAKIKIVVPYFRSKWACVDPTHKHFFSADTLGYFTHGHEYNSKYKYSENKFRMIKRSFNEGIDQTVFQKLLIPIAENYTEFYENKISPMFPLETLTFHMEPVK